MRGLISAVLAVLCAHAAAPLQAGDWAEDLSAIPDSQWSARNAGHLLERAGFAGTPAEIATFAKLTPGAAVAQLLDIPAQSALPPFEHSGIFDPGLDPFPPSRPATTQAAKANGKALGIEVKASGNRPVQPIVNKFFYWLRASRLETDRVAYWWANRMLTSAQPLQEKMALFWHGHFATNEDKVRDYRKMLQQLELFQREGLGNFRTLLIAVAQDPAMLTFLDAGVNVKGAPNENFAREIMELFTMGVGHYSEEDVREAARAFTGWNYEGLSFHINASAHDAGEKTVLGRTGNFGGVEVIDIILEQPATADFIAGKLYRYFVRTELSASLQRQLGAVLRDSNYDLKDFLATLFLAKDFYDEATIATHIKSPVELVISTYRKLGLTRVPGVPDFNVVTGALGQRLMHPPTVAGWSQGRSWITPALLFERGNFILDVVFPDIGFIPPDRYPFYGFQILQVQERLRAGMDISAATKPGDADVGMAGGEEMMAASNLLADRDEAFNTRYGSFRGWQMALERVKPITRDTARLNLTAIVMNAELTSPLEVIDYFAARFVTVPLDAGVRESLAVFFETELGTADVASAESYMEDALRVFLHVLLSRPEYQLG